MMHHHILRYSLAVLVLLSVAGCAGSGTGPKRQFPPPGRGDRHTQVRPKPPLPPTLMARPSLPSLRGRTVVIDAGHGGKDPGTRGVSRLQEKTIVLLVANEVARLLQARGAYVVSTRTTDRFLELDQRAGIATRYRADLFVSVHADSAQRKAASGSTVYICRGAASRSVAAAQSIHHALASAGVECRGIQRANYRVLVAHGRPAVLVECGFLTNSGDAARLNTMAYRSKVAAAIARGIADYLSR